MCPHPLPSLLSFFPPSPPAPEPDNSGVSSLTSPTSPSTSGSATAPSTASATLPAPRGGPAVMGGAPGCCRAASGGVGEGGEEGEAKPAGEEGGMEVDDDVGFLGHLLHFPKGNEEEVLKAERDYEVIDPRQRGARAKEEEREREKAGVVEVDARRVGSVEYLIMHVLVQLASSLRAGGIL